MDSPSRESDLAERAPGPVARVSRPLAAPVLLFDLKEEEDKLRKEGRWLEHGRNAVTLVKQPDLRVVFIVMKPGTRLQEHHPDESISIHALSGHVRLHLKDRTIELPSGLLLALERDVLHDVEAVEESTVLLTIAWHGEGSSC